MIELKEIDLPTYARVTVNRIADPIDPRMRILTVLRVELPHDIRIDAQWDQNDGGYWITAWQVENGNILELARRWAKEKDLAVATVESLARSVN